MAKKFKPKEEAQNRYLEHYTQVKEKLLQINNVVAVGIGLKEKDGQFTDEVSYKVFVPEKIALAALRPEEVVPKQIMRLKTDVIKIYEPVETAFVERIDTSDHRPIKGGIGINSAKTRGSLGTLGWFGTSFSFTWV